MKIYNTMTRQKEEFVPNDPKDVKIMLADRLYIIIFISVTLVRFVFLTF